VARGNRKRFDDARWKRANSQIKMIGYGCEDVACER
jgi:hypothetical protein